MSIYDNDYELYESLLNEEYYVKQTEKSRKNIINLIKKYENTNDIMFFDEDIRSDLYHLVFSAEFDVFTELLSKCKKNIKIEDLCYICNSLEQLLFDQTKYKERTGKELPERFKMPEELQSLLNEIVTLRDSLRNSLRNSLNNSLNNSNSNLNNFNMINSNESFKLSTNNDFNINDSSEKSDTNEVKELIISEIRTLREDEKEIKKDILKESARIIFQTSFIGVEILGLIITAITNKEKIMSEILDNYLNLFFDELSLRWLTGQSYFEAWDSLIDNINKKYKISINKKELKEKLSSLNLDEINNDLEENKHVK